MDGIFEEPAVALGFQDWADLTALSGTGFDVVQAVDTGRRLIDRQDCGCLDADGYTADMPRSAVALVYAAAVSVVIVAAASAASLLILASGWTL